MTATELYDEWKADKTEKQKNAFKEILDKNNIEFNRYKQDCRKRALELAHIDKSHLAQGATGMEDHHQLILERADKYYNWLISIPEK